MDDKFVKSMVGRESSHIAGFIAIHADAAFLNGAGTGSGEDKNVTTVKRYFRGKTIPYVSSQAFRRWWRNTAVQNSGWEASPLEVALRNAKGNPSKIATRLDPIIHAEDDIFGYMFALKEEEQKKLKKLRKEGKIEDKTIKLEREGLPIIPIRRTSPLRTNLLRGVPELTYMARDEGYVHLKDDNPLPYTTQFYSADMISSFGLDLYRLGVFEKQGKAFVELNPDLKAKHKDKVEEKLHPYQKNGEIVVMKDLIAVQNKRAVELIKALTTLSGGAKMAQFGTDVTPRLFVLAGMSRPLMIFDDLLREDGGKPSLNVPLLKELIADFGPYIKTKVYIGLRESYLANQDEVRQLHETTEGNVKIFVGTPQSIVDEFETELK